MQKMFGRSYLCFHSNNWNLKKYSQEGKDQNISISTFFIIESCLGVFYILHSSKISCVNENKPQFLSKSLGVIFLRCLNM